MQTFIEKGVFICLYSENIKNNSIQIFPTKMRKIITAQYSMKDPEVFPSTGTSPLFFSIVSLAWTEDYFKDSLL